MVDHVTLHGHAIPLELMMFCFLANTSLIDMTGMRLERACFKGAERRTDLSTNGGGVRGAITWIVPRKRSGNITLIHHGGKATLR